MAAPVRDDRGCALPTMAFVPWPGSPSAIVGVRQRLFRMPSRPANLLADGLRLLPRRFVCRDYSTGGRNRQSPCAGTQPRNDRTRVRGPFPALRILRKALRRRHQPMRDSGLRHGSIVWYGFVRAVSRARGRAPYAFPYGNVDSASRRQSSFGKATANAIPPSRRPCDSARVMSALGLQPAGYDASRAGLASAEAKNPSPTKNASRSRRSSPATSSRELCLFPFRLRLHASSQKKRARAFMPS